MSDSPDYFCYITITNSTAFISNCATSSLSILLAIYIVYKFCKMRGSHNKQTAFVYSNMIVWWLTFAGSTAYSAWLYQQSQDAERSYSDAEISKNTKYYFIIDWVNGYFIQLLLLYVPYHWCKGICVLFSVGISHSRSVRGSEVLLSEPYSGLQTKIYPFLKIYIIFRLIWITMPLLFLFTEWGQHALFKIQIGCLLLDCIIIVVSLLLGMISLKTSQELNEMLDTEELTQMFNRYLLIIVASFIRFAVDVIVFTGALKDSTFESTCPAQRNPEEPINYVSEVMIDVLITVLAHYFPIFIITRMYTLEEKPEQICKSLIITTAIAGTGLLSTD